MSQSPSIGRIVHYQPRGGSRPLPAVVVRVWDGAASYPAGTVNLQVFLDGTNEACDRDPANPSFTAEEMARGMAWRTSVHHSEEPAPHTWHWPPRVA